MKSKLPEGWKTKKINNTNINVTDYVANGSFKSLKENVKYLDKPSYAILIRLTDYNNNYKGDFRFLSKDSYEFLSKTKLYGEEIIISNVGANTGTVFKCPKLEYKMSLGPNAVVLKIDEKDREYVNDFIYYWFKGRGGQGQIKSIISGSAQPKFNKTNFRELEIPMPTFREQKAIADTLSALDDKIELNNKINENLEQQAQALFKHWFIDFEFPDKKGNPYKSSGGEMIESELGMIPKGWEVFEFQDIIKFRNGYGFKSKETSDIPIKFGYKVFKMGDIKVGGGINPDKTKSWITYDYLKENKLEKHLAKKGDLLMCMTDMKNNMKLLGHTALMPTDDDYVVNQRVGHIREKNDIGISYPYLYILTNNNKFIDDLRGRSNSGVQVNLTTSAIKETKLVVGPKGINIKFDKITRLMIEKIFMLEQQNKNLSQLRDILLPKLMSGEIRIPLNK